MLCVLFFLSSCAGTPSVQDVKKADAHYKLGYSYFRNNRLNQAFIEFQKAIKLNPKDRDALNALGNISSRFKEYDEAISYYKRAISTDPNYSVAMNNLGVTYIEIERLDEAIKYFRMALKNPLYITPEKANANLGLALYKKGDHINAVKTLKEAILKYPDFPQLYYILGLVHIKLDNTEAAIEEFKNALETVPKYITGDYIDLHWELANTYLRTGEIKNALKHFKIISESKDKSEKHKKALEYIELLKE